MHPWAPSWLFAPVGLYISWVIWAVKSSWSTDGRRDFVGILFFGRCQSSHTLSRGSFVRRKQKGRRSSSLAANSGGGDKKYNNQGDIPGCLFNHHHTDCCLLDKPYKNVERPKTSSLGSTVPWYCCHLMACGGNTGQSKATTCLVVSSPPLPRIPTIPQLQ